MMNCYAWDPKDRPSIKEVIDELRLCLVAVACKE
jgi:hypothetical protein